MFICAETLLDASGKCFEYLTEVAVAKVQQEFFNRVLDLNPRMVPGIDDI